ncbi:unnamed protein product [Ectocarpus sp. 4 AP-2014]
MRKRRSNYNRQGQRIAPVQGAQENQKEGEVTGKRNQTLVLIEKEQEADLDARSAEMCR